MRAGGLRTEQGVVRDVVRRELRGGADPRPHYSRVCTTPERQHAQGRVGSLLLRGNHLVITWKIVPVHPERHLEAKRRLEEALGAPSDERVPLFGFTSSSLLRWVSVQVNRGHEESPPRVLDVAKNPGIISGTEVHQDVAKQNEVCGRGRVDHGVRHREISVGILEAIGLGIEVRSDSCVRRNITGGVRGCHVS